MGQRRGWVAIFLVLLLLAGCRGSGGPNQPAQTPDQRVGEQETHLDNQGPGGEGVATEEPLDAGIAAALDTLATEAEASPPNALQGWLNVSPAVIGPGGTITLSGDGSLSGDLEVIGSGLQPIHLENGSASLTIPESLPEGTYVAALRTETGITAWGMFRVASAAGVWLRADRMYADERQPTILSVETIGLPDGIVGAVYVGDSRTPYVPTEDGSLRPGPLVPAAELVGRPLLLDEGLTGPLQVRLESDPFAPPVGEAESWESNVLPLDVCSQGAALRGTFDGPGFVNAIWIDGEIKSRTRFGEAGEFVLAVDPGMVLVQTFPLDGPVREAFLPVGCGEEKQLGSAGNANRRVESRLPGGNIALASLSLNRPALAPLPQAGGGEACRSGLIFPVVTVDGNVDEDLTRAAGVALKVAIFEAAPEASVVTQADIADLIDQAAEAWREGGEAAGLPALELAVRSTEADFLINLRAARLGREFYAIVTALPLRSGDVRVDGSGSGGASALTSSSFSAYQTFSEKFGHAAICGEVQPEEEEVDLGERVAIQYRLKDLSGEDVNGADITISEPYCGDLNPEDGVTENGRFETTYTYPEDDSCIENLEFNAEWGGPSGRVKTRAREAIAHLYPAPVTMKVFVGYVPGVSSEANLSAAVTFFKDWEIHTAPGGMAPIGPAGNCNYLEGGQEVTDDFWYSRSSQGGKNAEGYVSLLPSLETGAGLDGEQGGSSVPLRSHLRFFTRASAFPTRDDGIARSATGFAGNYSDALATGNIASTVFLFDIHNPGLLPNIHPAFVWESGITNDGGSYEALLFYKVIKCGTDAGLESLDRFFSVNAEMLASFSDEESGPTQGNIILPEIDEERYQVLLYVITVASAGSIQDSEDNMYHSGIARLQVDLMLYFAQERPGE